MKKKKNKRADRSRVSPRERRLLSTDEIVALIVQRLKHTQQKALAREVGISPQYMSDVLKRRREPGPALCAFLGYERVPSMYRKITR